MDQAVISGAGNIYANDALWEAKINPRRAANSLRRQQYKDLLALIKELESLLKSPKAMTSRSTAMVDLPEPAAPVAVPPL